MSDKIGIENPFENKIQKSRKTYEKFLKNGEHYFYIDNDKKEWKFTEINGCKNYYYFKCSTYNCKGFGKLERKTENNDNINNKFELTKQHSIDYTEHTYYKTHIINNIIKSENFTKQNWKDKNFRTNFFRHYFENNKYCSINQCIEYTKGKFNINKIEMTDKLKKEINSAKYVVLNNVKNGS